MTLFELARGPLFQLAAIMCTAGITWRLIGSILAGRRTPGAPPRGAGAFSTPLWGGVRTIFSRSFTRNEFSRANLAETVLGYLFHAGFVLVVSLFVPHIELVTGLAGVAWSGLPNVVIEWIAWATVAFMLALLARRLYHPVLKAISSFDDYWSWLMTFLPLVTGLLATAHAGPRYETMLGIHVLSVDLLLIWLPFGKLVHAVFVFPVRARNGAHFHRRGVSA